MNFPASNNGLDKVVNKTSICILLVSVGEKPNLHIYGYSYKQEYVNLPWRIVSHSVSNDFRNFQYARQIFTNTSGKKSPSLTLNSVDDIAKIFQTRFTTPTSTA